MRSARMLPHLPGQPKASLSPWPTNTLSTGPWRSSSTPAVRCLWEGGDATLVDSGEGSGACGAEGRRPATCFLGNLALGGSQESPAPEN
jgi:hypothetical protein